MMMERFVPQTNKIIKYRMFEVKTHINITSWITYDGEEHTPSCLKCDKKIAYHERCFYAWKYRDEVIRIIKNSVHKVCFTCGIEILKNITPKKELDNFNKTLALTGKSL